MVADRLIDRKSGSLSRREFGQWAGWSAAMATLGAIPWFASLSRKEAAASLGSSPEIRVNLTGKTKKVSLAASSAFEIRDFDSREIIARRKAAPASDLIIRSESIEWSDASWRSPSVELVPLQEGTLTLNRRRYRGSLCVHRISEDSVLVVNRIGLEGYLASVVASEMPDQFGEQALASQSIVSRTYALYRKLHAAPNALYDVHASARSQHYLGMQYPGSQGQPLAGETAKSRSVVQQTAGLVCLSQGKPMLTFFSAVCGGATTPSSEVFTDHDPPLGSVPCEWCQAAPLYRWQTQMKRQDLEARLSERGTIPRGKSVTGCRTISPKQDVGIPAFEFTSGDRQRRLTGIELRQLVPTGFAHSPRFDLEFTNDTVIFRGRGFGHGVGFCQWGARGQSLAGRSAHEIVQHYYPGCTIKPWSEHVK